MDYVTGEGYVETPEHEVATGIVLGGLYLPAHDEVFGAANEIEDVVNYLFEYVKRVRDEVQARNAVNELLEAFKM